MRAGRSLPNEIKQNASNDKEDGQTAGTHTQKPKKNQNSSDARETKGAI